MNVAVDVPMIARIGVLGPDNILCVITPCSSLTNAPVCVLPSISPPRIILRAQASKSSKLFTVFIDEKASNSAINKSPSSSLLAIFRIVCIASRVSFISSVRVFSRNLRLPAPKALKSSDLISLALLASVKAINIVFLICSSGPSTSVISTKSLSSRPAMPKSLTCCSKVPTTMSATTTYLLVMVDILSIILPSISVTS